MTHATPTLRRLAVALAAWVIAACGGGGGGGGPTSPPPPTSGSGSATFRLAGAGLDQTISYGGGNLVFCRRNAGWADLWIRLAEQAAGDGEAGPHLDIDVCNHASGGTFAPMDPQAARCGAGQTFDIWWHGASDVFVNGLASRSCSLTLMRSGTRLSGTFACQGMAHFAGANRTLDVLDGSFQCEER